MIDKVPMSPNRCTPTMTAKNAQQKTPPAAMSFIFFIAWLKSFEIKSQIDSTAVFNISDSNTKDMVETRIKYWDREK
jgi:hypothetical protein